MAKPRQPKHNRINKPKEPGDGAEEGGGEGAAVRTEKEGGGGGRRKNPKTTPLPAENLTDRGWDMSPERAERTLGKQRTRREKRRKTGTERPHGGGVVEVTRRGGGSTPPEEKVDLPGFTPESAHLLLQGVYEHFPHHNAGSRLYGGIMNDSVWQSHWRRLAAPSASWYATPSGSVGCRFTAILAAEWQGFLNRSLNSERPLVFAHVVLTKTLGVRRAREIRDRITWRMDLWERGLHMGMVGDSEAEGAAREGRAASGGEE